MLIGLRVKNFRSFWGEQELSYVTSADRAHETTHCIRTGIRAAPRVSRAALIFGPNAAGKSNFILAIATFRDLVLNSNSFTDGQFAERYTPFGFGGGEDRPTEFEIEIFFEQLRYRYMVSYNAQRIVAERLLVFRTGKSQRWFERHFDDSTQSEEWAPFSPSFSGPREMWRKATRSKALFLTSAAQLNSEQLQPLVNWFAHGLEVVSAKDIADPGRLAAHIEDNDLKARMLSIVRSADLPIDDFRVAQPDTNATGVASNRSPVRPLTEFLHSHRDKAPVWLDASFESAGTHRLLGLLGPLLRSIDRGKLLVVDDFDANLHPLLARMLIRLIHYPAMAGRSAQLLLTSHNSTLMDLDILRRDEIWLMELDEHDSSRLSPLLRSSPRKHEMIAKAYMRGRYGAIPTVRTEYLGAVTRPPSRAEDSSPPDSGPMLASANSAAPYSGALEAAEEVLRQLRRGSG